MLNEMQKQYLSDKYRRIGKYTGNYLSDAEIRGRIKDIELLTKTNEPTIKIGDSVGYGLSINKDNNIFSSGSSINFPIIARDSEEARALAKVMDDTQTPQFNINSSGVPQPFTTIYTSQVIKELYKKTALKEIAGDAQQGVWGVTDVKFPVRITGGLSQLYSDISIGGQSVVNYNWVARQVQYWEQSLVYGEMQQATFSLAKIDIVSDLREAMAESIAQQQNDLGFYGWAPNGGNAGYFSLFGILNEPNLAPAITFPNDGTIIGTTTATTSWAGKTFAQIQRDIRLLIVDLVKRSTGWVRLDTIKGKLVLPPSIEPYLSMTTDYGYSVRQWMKDFIPNITVVTTVNFESSTIIPQNPNSTNAVMLLVEHPKTGEMPFKEIFVTKLQGFRPFVQSTALVEKVGYGLGGVILFYPYLVSYAFGV